MTTQWEGRVKGKTRATWKTAFTVARTAGGAGTSEPTGVLNEAQEVAIKLAADLLLDALGITATDTNFQVSAQGFDNTKGGSQHEAHISLSVQKHLA